jgi:hypothetical protein
LLFTHKPRPSFPLATQINSKYSRKYETISGKLYPSITTILSATSDKSGIDRWRKSVGESVADFIVSNALDTGTRTHKLAEEYLNNRPYSDSHSLLSEAHLNKLKPFLHKINHIYGTELALFSDIHSMAGTCDCVAEYDGKLSIIDFKTSRKEKREDWITNYFLQATAYSIMWEELTNIPINQIVILISGEDNTVSEFVRDPNNYKEELFQTLEKYHIQNKIPAQK